MTKRTNANLTLLGVTTAIVLGIGCGGGGGLGGSCAGLGGGGLPASPGPWGLPMDQAVEGGGQVRITKPGFDKISSLIPSLAGGALPSMANPQCLGQQQFALKIAGTGADAKMCDGKCGGGNGCPVWVTLRPDLAPPGGIAISMADGNNPQIKIDAAFDVNMVIPLAYRLCIFGACGGWNNVCDLHVNGPGTHVNASLNMGIDAVTGALTLAVGDLTIPGLNLGVSNCGLVSELFNAVLGVINTVAKSFIGNAIIGLLKPQLDKLIQGFLPNPPGLVTKISTGTMLASFDPPKDAALETLLVAGGYVSAKGGGLNLGLITGMNSDRNEATRDPGKASEASLCVPQRPVINLGTPPWNLPAAAARPDRFALAVANEFSGSPDPMDIKGNTQDLAIGISRTFLDLAGFHIYNSGTLCLSISGGILSALNAGAVSVLVPSLSNILENRKAPLAIRLRPEQPLRFTMGAGTDKDPLLRIQITDLRVDFYVFIEERYVRLFTLALDLNVGLNLTVGMDANGKPTIAPTITGIDKSNVTARVLNTDLLQEDPAKLAKSLLSLIDIAVGQIGGGIKPIALPSLMGFSLDGLAIQRVQTQQDDFLAIFGSLMQDPMHIPWALPEDVVAYERQPASVDTLAEVLDVSVPPPDVIREAAMAGQLADGNTPTVTLKLGGSTGNLEWSYRVDGAIWSAWSGDSRPTIADPTFILQGKHGIDVRARVKGDWTTEDQTPEHLEVVIDSVPPELKLHVDRNKISFEAWDNVSDTDAIRYSWDTPAGATQPGSRTWLSLDEAWAASNKGERPLMVNAYDQIGNHVTIPLPLASIEEFHGRTTAPAAAGGGCGCEVGGGRDSRHRREQTTLAWLALLPLAALAFRRSRRRA